MKSKQGKCFYFKTLSLTLCFVSRSKQGPRFTHKLLQGPLQCFVFRLGERCVSSHMALLQYRYDKPLDCSEQRDGRFL